MKKADAIFSVLIAEIRRISEDADEAYWEALDPSAKDSFDAICDELSALRLELEAKHAMRSTGVELPRVKSVLKRFNEGFGNYPGFNYSKLSYQLALSAKICDVVDEIPDEDVNPDFGVIPCTLGFPSKAFVSDVSPIGNNLAWFNPSNQDSLNTLTASQTDVEIWYSLASLCENIDFSQGTEILFGLSSCISERENVISLLKIYMLARGEKVTKSIEYLNPPQNSSINSYDPSLNYAQFGEIVQIMGEYVARKDVLSKYLSIYHVIESFMFKYPIVKLERSRNGVMFSIRDFKSLYKAVETNELEAVSSLMRAAFDLQFGVGTIGQEIHQRWNAFLMAQAADINEIDNFLDKMNVRRVSFDNQASFHKHFSTLLYRIRCSVVHNKETEYHISSENYTAGCRLVLEKFYLPALEEVIFLLLSQENDVVWYKSDSIKLWNSVA